MEILWAEQVERMGDRRGAYRVLVRTREGMRPLERPRHRCENNIKIDLSRRVIGTWTGLIWLRTG
jgi:hypothetical protein